MSGGDGPVSSGAELVSGAAYLIVFVRRTRPHVGPGAGGLERGAGRASGPRAGRRCRLTGEVWVEVRSFGPLAGHWATAWVPALEVAASRSACSHSLTRVELQTPTQRGFLALLVSWNMCRRQGRRAGRAVPFRQPAADGRVTRWRGENDGRSEEHTSELQS